jgi:hypothetical protein
MTPDLHGEPEPPDAHGVIGSDRKSSIAGHRIGFLEERAMPRHKPGNPAVMCGAAALVTHQTQRAFK